MTSSCPLFGPDLGSKIDPAQDQKWVQISNQKWVQISNQKWNQGWDQNWEPARFVFGAMPIASFGYHPAWPLTTSPKACLTFRRSAFFLCAIFLFHSFFFLMGASFPLPPLSFSFLRGVSAPSGVVAVFGNPMGPLWGTWNFHENHHIFGKTGFRKISLPAAGYATHFGECARSRLGTLRDRLSSLSSIDS